MKRLTFIVNWFLGFLGLSVHVGPAAASPVPELPRPAAWTSEDADQLKRFLVSVTGQKLSARLQAVAYKTALDESYEPTAPRRAAGYDACRGNIISLATAHEIPVKQEDFERELTIEERHSA